jgi:hypothetical protein
MISVSTWESALNSFAATVISAAARITRVRDGKDLKLSFYIRIIKAFYEYATEREIKKMWKEISSLVFRDSQSIDNQ